MCLCTVRVQDAVCPVSPACGACQAVAGPYLVQPDVRHSQGNGGMDGWKERKEQGVWIGTVRAMDMVDGWLVIDEWIDMCGERDRWMNYVER